MKLCVDVYLACLESLENWNTMKSQVYGDVVQTDIVMGYPKGHILLKPS